MGSPMGPGMPPGGPPGPPGGPMMQQGLAGLAGGMPGGDPLQALKSLQANPTSSAEQDALKQAREAIGFAMSRVYKRSPKVAKELSAALINLEQAMKELQTLPQPEPAAPPPPGLPMSGMLTGGPPGGMGGPMM